MSKRPLFILVADSQMEAGLGAFFDQRDTSTQKPSWHFKLSCSPFVFDNTTDLKRFPTYTDHGLYAEAHTLLMPMQRTHERALVILDIQFPGTPEGGSAQLRSRVLDRLHTSGWAPGTVEVVVIEPCFEAWLWSDDVHVEKAFGHNRPPTLRQLMETEGYWPAGATKPAPGGTGAELKAATKFALHRGDQKLHSLTFRKVFGSPRNLSQCAEPGFNHLRATLQRWFPIQQP
jgi:hypothetical protein